MTNLPAGLRDLSWELPRNFLGLDDELAAWERARAVILPVPYEATTSYGGGTSRGPGAIIEASRFIELYDQELDLEPNQVGIATLPELHLTGAGPGEAIPELRAAYDAILHAGAGKFVVMLGGEHSITSAPVLAWADALAAAGKLADGKRLSVLQFDAHTDLRDAFVGTAYSHAAVMYQVHERVDLTAVGIRALTREERELARRTPTVNLFLADDIHEGDAWMDDVLARLGDYVYISFDVDAFDPALVPSTGTPEPGGLQWYPVLKLLKRVFAEREVVSCDVVELAPIPGFSAPDFLVAKLVYKILGYKFFSRSSE